MQCERAQELISAHRDGELSPEETQSVADHIAACRSCRDTSTDYERIGRALRQQGRARAPSALVTRVRASLATAKVDTASISETPAAHPLRDATLGAMRSLGRQAAALAAVALLSALAAWWLTLSASHSTWLEREVLNAHIRSLLQDTPVQVASSDRHTVRPWFAGRADFAPAVKDLDQEGFQLIGGRLDYIDDRRVGALVYKRRLHVINVFMWPARAVAESTPSASTRNGYNMLSWSRNGVAYWLVSDLNVDELKLLSTLL